MSEVIFTEEPGAATPRVESPVPGLAGVLVRAKIVSTEKQASFILGIIALLLGAAAIIILIIGTPQTRVPTPAELEAIREMETGTRAR